MYKRQHTHLYASIVTLSLLTAILSAATGILLRKYYLLQLSHVPQSSPINTAIALGRIRTRINESSTSW